ncbi:MAG: cardiolipin synthase [Lachnospiraceae bacterium]
MSRKREFDEEKVLILDKGKRGLLRIVFGRTTIILVLFVIQLLVLIGIFNWLQQYLPYLYSIYLIALILVIQYVINNNMIAEMQLSWVILILGVPVIGLPMFLLTRFEVGNRILNARLQEILKESEEFAYQEPKTKVEFAKLAPEYAGLASYLRKKGGFPVYKNTQVTYYPLGEDMFEAMFEDLKKAKKFIFLEFFIVSEGYMLGKILNLLQEKVREGVEVRLMYDGTCSLFNLPYNYPNKIRALGIDCKVFSPIYPVFSTSYNNRDHRKILVVDGQVAYTGGVNLADEYINRKKRFGHWKDTAIRLEGDAVRSFTMMFLQMWDVNHKLEDFNLYLDDIGSTAVESDGFVIPYSDSPLDKENVGENVYIDMIARAVHYVHIMTPYLILDESMIHALTYAAKRGVDVSIILPHIPDKKTAFALAHGHYPQLIRAGVKIYEYTPGFVHAKVVVCDDKSAVVGTINFDYRSLYLHFECAAFLYGMKEIQHIEEDFQKTKEQCIRYTLEDCKNESWKEKVMSHILKIVAPLM